MYAQRNYGKKGSFIYTNNRADYERYYECCNKSEYKMEKGKICVNMAGVLARNFGITSRR